jgi:hypothetical protein
MTKQPPPTPRKDQWLYVRSLEWDGKSRTGKPRTQEYWHRGDGALEAMPPKNSGFVSTFSKDKTLWPPVLDYGEVAALPGDPDRLLAWINAKVDAHEAAIAPFVARLKSHHQDHFLMTSGLRVGLYGREDGKAAGTRRPAEDGRRGQTVAAAFFRRVSKWALDRHTPTGRVPTFCPCRHRTDPPRSRQQPPAEEADEDQVEHP